MSNHYYNTNIKVTYKNNTEYRNALRNVFSVDITKTYNDTKLSDIEDLDEETADEMTYDETSISYGLTYIYEKTRNHPLFVRIYTIAAGKMLSMDPEIGLTILLSYDYFEIFHCFLVDFFHSPENLNEMNIHYITLLEKIY
jgi:hypothetical protein